MAKAKDPIVDKKIEDEPNDTDKVTSPKVESESHIKLSLKKKFLSNVLGSIKPQSGQKKVKKPKPVKHGRFEFLILGFILASLLGGAIGIIGSKMLAGPDKYAGPIGELESSIVALKRTLQAEADKLNQTKTAGLKAESDLGAMKLNLEIISAQVTVLTDSVTASEQAKQSEISAAQVNGLVISLADRTAIIEALLLSASEDNAEPLNIDITDGANSLAKRLQSLEAAQLENQSKLEQYEAKMAIAASTASANNANTQPEFPKPDTTPIELPKGTSAAETQEAFAILIDTFPRQKMLAAVRAQEAIIQKKPGWLQRALRKHIKVRANAAPNPYVLIDQAEAALNDRRISDTLALLAKLNPPVRVIASKWISAAKKAASSIEQQQ